MFDRMHVYDRHFSPPKVDTLVGQVELQTVVDQPQCGYFIIFAENSYVNIAVGEFEAKCGGAILFDLTVWDYTLY